MGQFAAQGFSEFVVALGFGAEIVQDYFQRSQALHNGWWANPKTGTPWTIQLVDTGLMTVTGGRLKRLGDLLHAEERFFLTYCDGLTDLDLNALLRFHLSHGRSVTLTAVRAPSRFGLMEWSGDRITAFRQKPPADRRWVSGGFFVVDRPVLDVIGGDDVSWERDVLPMLAASGELMGFRHEGFFEPVDTPKERDAMELLWTQGSAPWRKP
jgi:glucose-1-phosphate cytidylyltransferase